MSVAASRAPSYGMELASPPSDGVTAVRFSHLEMDQLLVSSWDKDVRLYNVSSNTLRYSISHGAPALDCCFLDEENAFSVGLDAKLKMLNFNQGASSVVGSHEKPIRCVLYLPDQGLTVTGSWDRNVCTWDHRQGGANPVHRLRQEGKVFSMSSYANRLVVASSSRKVAIYDVRKLDLKKPELEVESSLKYQTRCVRCFPNGLGYAAASIEGRVAMEYFSQDAETQAKKYAFKCHRRVEGGKEYVYPVNTIAFHPLHGTFATGGCDGIVNIWDGENKKRLYQYARYTAGIADLCFNAQGTKLAVAASYTFEQGEKDHELDAIFVRDVGSEVKPKSKVQA